MPDLPGRNDDGLRQAADQVTAADLGVRLVRGRAGRSDRHLDLLGGPFAQHERVLLLDEDDDRLVHFVAADADGLGGYDAAERDHRYLGGPAAHVHDHVAGRLVHRQPGADRGRHRLLDDVDAAGTGLVPGFFHRALLHAGDPARHGHHQPRLGEVPVPVHLLDEVAQHPLGDVEVGDDAILERPDGHDVAGRPADHPFGLHADRDDLAVVRVERHHRWLVQHDPAPPHVHQGVRGAEIDRHVAAENRKRVAHNGQNLPGRFRGMCVLSRRGRSPVGRAAAMCRSSTSTAPVKQDPG